MSGNFRFLKPGWWLVHFLGIGLMYFIGVLLSILRGK